MKMAAVATAAAAAYVLGWMTRQPEVVAARREASTDALTGLVNRTGLKRLLHNRTERGIPYTLYMLDLNGFKAVNDRFGHRAGDLLLAQMGQRLQHRLSGHLVARLGGDEFMVLTAGHPAIGPADALAREIMKLVAVPTPIPGSPDPVTLGTAIGIARAAPGADYRAAMHAADQAMYRSKATGKPHHVTVTLRQSVDESPRLRIRNRRPVRVS